MIVKVEEEDWFSSLFDAFGSWKDTSHRLSHVDNAQLFKLACSSARHFLRINFVGPLSLPNWVPESWNGAECEEYARQHLYITNKVVPIDCQLSVHSRGVVLLWLASLIIIQHKAGQEQNEFEWLRWKLRVLALWQRCVGELNVELKEEGYATIEQLRGKMDEVGLGAREQVMVSIECTMFTISYRDITHCRIHLDHALSCSGVQIELGGALGKRTHFQQKLVAQLQLQVTCDSNNSRDGQLSDANLPHSVSLTDDTLMENIKFEKMENEAPLTRLQQALILAVTIVNSKARAKDELFIEEQTAYVSQILESPLDWSIQMSALYLRTQLESTQRRCVERALAQAEEMIKTIESNHDLSVLSEYAWMLKALTPLWELKQLHCQLLISLGCYSEALAIFTDLHDYDGMVTCLRCLGRKEQAMTLLNEMLEKQPNEPRLLCSLGDMTDNPNYYQTAWQVSHHRYARAIFSLGKLYIDRKRISEAYDCIELALNLLPLRWDAWFSLGYCAMKLEKFSDAAKAFHRCVSIEPEHAESWNNLAAAYLHLNEKERAFPILEVNAPHFIYLPLSYAISLQEALKFSHTDGKLWENLLTVAVDTKRFKEAAHAYHRILDFRPNFIDEELLEVMADHTTENVLDDMQTLFGRITSRGCTMPNIWISYAKLYPYNMDQIDGIEKRITIIQKAHAQFTRDDKLEQNTDSFIQYLFNAEQFALAQIKLMQLKCDYSTSSSLRLMLNGVLSRCKKMCDKMLPSDENIDKVVNRLYVLLQQIEK